MISLTTSVFVGDLPPHATQSDLLAAFGGYHVKNIRIDKARNGSTFGIVELIGISDIEEFMYKMQQLKIRGKLVHVMLYEPDIRRRLVRGGNVFVTKIPPNTSQADLYRAFQRYGKIVSCKLVMKTPNISRGYAYVQFDSAYSAAIAKECSGTLPVKDRLVNVYHFLPRNMRHPNSSVLPFNNCYVKNFGPDAEIDSLLRLFGQYGDLTSFYMAKYPNNKLKGYGFICFKSFTDAMTATEALNGTMFNGRKIVVCRAEKIKDRAKAQRALFRSRTERTLVVKNLNGSMDEEYLKSYFEKYAPVMSTKVLRYADGTSKKIAYVLFVSPDVVKKVMESEVRYEGGEGFTFERALMPSLVLDRYESPN